MINFINIYALAHQTEVLGPFKRFGLWVQGCPMQCKGCLAPNSLNPDEGETWDISDLANVILNQVDSYGLEGITISGGEPFYQPEALVELIKILKSHRNLGIIVYSGYTLEFLLKKAENNHHYFNFLDKIDTLIDGHYVESQNDNLSLRGSKNQNVICLTDRYRHLIHEYYGKSERQIEVQLFKNQRLLIGIPGKESLLTWQNLNSINL